ncbi:MAG: response regulator [Anaerolineae bacterium]
MAQPVERCKLILLVDPHQLTCELLQMLLEEWGYWTLVARDEQTGVTLFNLYRSEISAVLLDTTVPTEAQIAFLQTLRREKPGLKCFLISGQLVAEEMAALKGDLLAGHIQKPFAIGVLAQHLEEVLGPALPAA